ncbi:MAG: M14 family zinc carboxypeptidase [Chitinophagales bacterium]|nr:immune inhibitor A [Bacteroidota bacterium]MCB9042952.1 immune inhibitor A [Chitinophagales bacterium]
MRNLLIVLVFIFAMTNIAVAQQSRFSHVRIWADKNELHKLQTQGICIDHGLYKHNLFFEGDFSAEDMQRLAASGVQYEVLAKNGQSFYQEAFEKMLRKKATAECNNQPAEIFDKYVTPEDFSLGSMGGFQTYEEILAHLDNMFAKFPNLISEKAAIGTFETVEGREIYFLKISDNPNDNEENEAKVLFTAVHHAREPQSATQMLYFMYYLLENYDKDDAIKYLVDNLEIYFIPCLNPDGYIYNQNTNPVGGGFWRKNRNGTGVDLNRNYGFHWGIDDEGSSPNPNSETYRGPWPFSEAETSAVKWLCEQVPFTIAQNYHTYSNMLIYPWGYVGDFETPDSLTFRAFGKEMTKENNYIVGTGNQTVGYLTNGDSDDWMYGEQITKNKILSFTPEVGSGVDGFWPNSARIEQLSRETMWMNLTTLRVCGNYAVLDHSNNANVISETNGFVKYTLQRLGLQGNGDFTVKLAALSPGVTIAENEKSYQGLNLLDSIADSIAFAIDEPEILSNQLAFLLSIDNGNYILDDTLKFVFQTAAEIVFNETDTINTATLAAWQATGDWGITDEIYHSAPNCITDSPYNDYNADELNTLTLVDTIDLSQAMLAELSFWARWDIEQDYDYVMINAVDVESGTATALCGEYTTYGNYYIGDTYPLYQGLQSEWVQEKMSLNDFLGKEILLRFDIFTDGGLEKDGFYFDDLAVNIQTEEEVDTVIGLEHLALSRDILVSNAQPNPSAEFTHINYQLPPWTQTANLLVYNALGQLVSSYTLRTEQGSFQIPTENLASGMYFYYIQTADTRSRVRNFQVQR